MERSDRGITGEQLNISDPGESEDFGQDWRSGEALTTFGERETTEPWAWAGPAGTVSGPTWGGCLEVLDQLALADRLPAAGYLSGSILLLETSGLLPSPNRVRRYVQALGEHGVLAAIDGILLARMPASNFTRRPAPEERARMRRTQRDIVIEAAAQYNPEAIICVGAPFGHTRPQWILPYGGNITMNSKLRSITASYA